MRISDWSSDVCSSDLRLARHQLHRLPDGVGHEFRQMPDRNLLHRADMVDVHGLAILPHRQDSIDNVVDITECPRLASVALNLDPILATGDSGATFLDQLGDAVFPRSEERRVGKGCVSTFRSRWWP